MAFPSTALLDSFTRANSASSAGANWTMSQQLFGISGNALYNATGSGFSIGYWNPITPGPDSECYAAISVLGGSNHETSLWVRMTNPVVANFTCYGITHKTTANTLRIRKFVNGTATDLVSVSLTLVAGEKLGVEVVGSTITAYRYTSGAWAVVTSATDTSITAAGRIGVTIQNPTTRVDDFSGGTVVSGGTPIAGTDTGTLTESTPVLLAASDVTDSAALTEAAALVIAEDVAGTDSAALTEAAALVIAQDVAGTDSAALTESTPVLLAVQEATDSAALTEAAALVIAQDVVGTDDATLIEASALVIAGPAVSVIVDNVMLAMR